jgi:hypothetical protein
MINDTKFEYVDLMGFATIKSLCKKIKYIKRS